MIEKLSELIRKYRSEQKLTLRQMAERCGLSYTYIEKLERGTDPRSNKRLAPTVETFKRLAKGMNMPLEVLLKEIGYLPPPPDEDSMWKIRTALSENPELEGTWEILISNEMIQEAVKEMRSLPHESMKRILRYIKMVELDEKNQKWFSKEEEEKGEQ